ncbi:hypothetical protein niasHT_029197 [Heterodera trifolii]|uniref:Uncharacterized protein n=1 Tax=Heterodera trifolii TaxID=157864 RepID=A0ABD2JZW0_9BILA
MDLDMRLFLTRTDKSRTSNVPLRFLHTMSPSVPLWMSCCVLVPTPWLFFTLTPFGPSFVGQCRLFPDQPTLKFRRVFESRAGALKRTNGANVVSNIGGVLQENERTMRMPTKRKWNGCDSDEKASEGKCIGRGADQNGRECPMAYPTSAFENDAQRKALRSKGERATSNRKNGEEGTGIGVGDFFPEVWLFNNFNIGMDGLKELRLNSTLHSVTDWHFLATFWSAGRPPVFFIRRTNLFMDVEVPLHVNMNESANVHIAVSAANLTQNRPLSVCFHGLSPKVCGDVGREGTFDETDFTRVVLTPENPVQLKNFFVRFLRRGIPNLSFEFRSEDVLKAHDWNYRDSETEVFDRIVKQIQVKRSVNVEEHFRQIVVYRRKRAEEGEETDEAEQGQRHGQGARGGGGGVDLGANTRPIGPTNHNHCCSLAFMLQPFLPDHTDQQWDTVAAEPVQTKVLINAGGRKVYNLGVEFSKFVPSFPPALSTELLSVASPLDPPGSAPLQRVGNRSPLNIFEARGQCEIRERWKKKTDKSGADKCRPTITAPPEVQSAQPAQGTCVAHLRTEIIEEDDDGGGWTTEREGEGEEKPMTESIEWMERRVQLLGNLLAKLLLTFSGCEFRLRECAFD